MRLAGTGLIVAALLALAGCKSTDKSGDKTPTGLGAGRLKNKDTSKDGKDARGDLAKNTPTWLDNMDRLPGSGTSVPKSTGPTNPKDPNFDPKTAAQDSLGGRVLDPYGKPARNVYVRVEQVGAPATPLEVGLYTDAEGYFFSPGFKQGKSYEVTAIATQDGKQLSGGAQTKVPNATLLILLRDDVAPPTGTFPPSPKPSDKGSDYIPPMGAAPSTPQPVRPKPPGEAWGPAGPTTGVPPATIGSANNAAPPPKTPGVAPPSGLVPGPDDLVPSPKPVRPESTADGPRDPRTPPPASIPNPNGPPVPKLPPPVNPVGGSGSSMGTNAGRTVDKFTLLDPMERTWDSDSMIEDGSLVLVEFMESSCLHCPKVIPILKDLQSRYGANGLQVMGVLCDDLPQKERAAAAGKYAQDHNLNYAVFIEPVKPGSVRDRLGVNRYPTVVLLNSAGKVLWHGHPGDTAKLEAAIKQGLSK